eukprot:CAMPEP_0167753438 /NCGR_PEP_ID=MMETSP0110_2-20121227/7715_1 /TAXON_ID=629695 /ORGANISM="Gymnochlora sp., Strain CCMP2014" /LENGTH=489 /DNA_ID=CAMNT_0007639207 /DNA_START=304 /DNA_END=1774 /DNA_ORIENTATION=+
MSGPYDIQRRTEYPNGGTLHDSPFRQNVSLAGSHEDKQCFCAHNELFHSPSTQFIDFATGFSDVGFVTLITWGMLKQKGPSVLLLFAFEFMILGVMITISAAKYLLFVNSAGSEGEPVRCCVKNVWLFYLDFTADLLRLFLLLIFFMIICTYYGLPIHLIREIWVTFYGLRDRILKFIQYRRLLRVLDHFPKATEEEMKDTICTICQDEMEDAIKLPCGHVFHKHCLHSWLFYDQRCPNCQTPISISMNMVNGEPEPAPNQAQQGAPAQNIPSAPASEQKSNASPAVESKKPVYARNPYWAPPTVAPAPTPTGEFIAPVQQTAPLPHIPFMIPSGISYGQPLTGASKEVLLRVSQRQTLMLQQHVDFLQSQLASTFQMLQQQLSLQEQLMKTQTTQEMATKLNSENKTTVQTDGKKDEKVLDEKHGAGADILGNENSSAAEEKEVISTVMKETSLEAHESDAAGKIRAARLQKFNSLSRQSTLEKDEKE